jgi:uncharacterized BrkB/YihY/UPF0761 family membrane protein
MSKKVIISFVVISVFASILIQYLRNDLNIGAIIGGAAAFVIGPYILSLLMRFLNKLFRRTPDEKSFITTYSIFWIGYFILNILGQS